MSEPAMIEIHALHLAERPVRMRLPFQFGNTEVRETAEIYCLAEVSVGGRRVQGVSAQLMVPRWFDKRAARSNAETVDDLRRAAQAAVQAMAGRSGVPAPMVEELRRDVEGQLDLPRLAAGFGPALVEMALIDAICRAGARPFWQAARDDLFGLGQDCPPDLTPAALRASLGRITRPGRMALRHTVGFDAPLEERPADAPGDGLPVTLREVMRDTGICAWKIKLKGDPEADAARLLALQAVLAGRMQGGVTLDANEQYGPEAFGALLARLRAPDLAEIAGKVRFFEQPFAREVAPGMRNTFGVPLIIDESDDHRDAFVQALGQGWNGTSIKSCKGVLRALLNRARADVAGAVLSGEDLTCQPGLCWGQDSAMAAACGVQDMERNGHHFAGGLQGGTAEEAAALAAHHGGIFALRDGSIALNPKEGSVDLSTLDQPGFGVSEAVLPMIAAGMER